MPSISQELESTRTARWYRAVQDAHLTGTWGDQVKCRTVLSAVLVDATHVAEGCGQPAARPLGVLGDTAEGPQEDQPIARKAAESPAIELGGAQVAKAKVTAFWPYREGVIKIADAFDMAPFEWAAAYLRALAAWASDNRSLAACHPTDPPGCVAEDMEVLAASRTHRADEPAVRFRAARLAELACAMIGLVLDDASVTPLGALNSVRNEVHQLLTGPSTSLADMVVQSVAELSDWILLQGDCDAVLTAGQAGQILGLLNGLGSLVASPGASCAEPEAE